MRLRIRYKPFTPIPLESWLIVAFVLYLMFIAAVWPWWFPVVDMGEVR